MSRPATPRAPPSFAALVQSFFTEHLTQQRAMSPRTVATYRDAFVLFLDFAVVHLHKQPTTMRLHDITPALILAFLDHLERDRGNAVRTRNARLAALRAFLKFAGHRDVEALHAQISHQAQQHQRGKRHAQHPLQTRPGAKRTGNLTQRDPQHYQHIHPVAAQIDSACMAVRAS